jgi:RNA polymerase sigma factor (sigma-70 family)
MADRDDVVQRIVLLLIDDNYRVLRSFDHCSRPQTWLYTIVRRHILLRLRDKGSTVSLDDVSSDFFTVQPDQEQWLLTKEREELLQTAVSNLTKREQMLFGLIRQGLDAEKVGEEMKIKRRSASVMKRLLIKKLQRIVRGK